MPSSSVTSLDRARSLTCTNARQAESHGTPRHTGRATFNPRIVGSRPTGPTICAGQRPVGSSDGGACDGLLPDFYRAGTGWGSSGGWGHGVEPQPELADELRQQVWAQKRTRSGNGGSGRVRGPRCRRVLVDAVSFVRSMQPRAAGPWYRRTGALGVEVSAPVPRPDTSGPEQRDQRVVLIPGGDSSRARPHWVADADAFLAASVRMRWSSSGPAACSRWQGG
jgi:hypothetical protein